jgi:6-phosphogluconolactonase
MHAAAESFVTAATAAVHASGRFLVALSGGATPLPLYALLASDDLRSAVEWPCVHVFWVDERCVPSDHAASNYRAVRETLLDHVEVSAHNVHRIRGEDEPIAAAAAYERELRSAFSTANGPPRRSAGARFDLVLLGMGDDGHTASLFPNSPALRERELWVMAQQLTGAPGWRVTLTPPVIDAASEVVFVVSGTSKAETLRRVLEGPQRPDELPAQAVAPKEGQLLWLVDADAAQRLTER